MFAINTYNGTGSASPYAVTFPYLSKDHVKVRVGGVLQTSGYTWINASTISLTAAAGVNNVDIRRETPAQLPQVVFYDGSTLTDTDLNQEALQLLYISQETADRIEDSNNRTIHFPVGEVNTSGTLPAAPGRSGTVLGFDALGNATILPVPAAVGAGDMRVDTFSDGVDFAAGVTTQLTLSRAPGLIGNVQVHFDAAYQGPDQIASLVGSVITFASAIPVGVQKVYVASGTTVSVQLPPDGSVTPPKLNLIDLNGGPADAGKLQVVRVANYSGGSFGYVNTALRVRTDVGVGAGTFESAGLFILNNSSTANNAENFAVLGQGNKMAATAVGTWGGVFEAHEMVATNNPSTPTIGVEVDIYANGTDSTLNRVGVGIFTKSQDVYGVACETGIGVGLFSNGGDTNPGKFHYGVSFGRFGSTTKFNYGIDFTYATFEPGGVPINLIANQAIAFAPSRNLTYNGAALSYQTPNNVGGVFQVLDNGNVQNMNNSYGAISDRRLKDNIEDIGDARAKLRKVRIRQYDMEGVHHFGVIAQEIKKVFPHLIEHLKRGKKKFMGVNYMGLLPWTVRYVQQVDEDVEALKKKVAQLESIVLKLSAQ